MSLSMVCKNDALDVVKTVTRKRGFEGWRKLGKEYGSTTRTSLHEYSNLLEYDFGTTDGFKKRLLGWENGKGKYGKSLGKYDKSNEYSTDNEYGKGHEKSKDKGKKGKGKGQGKDERPAPNSSFQSYCRSCGKWRYKGSECWQGYVQAVEEVPSSSTSSVALKAATTPAAAKTAAAILEVNDDHEPGWIFGVMGGSVSSVTSGTDDLRDELVLDKGLKNKQKSENAKKGKFLFLQQCQTFSKSFKKFKS